MKLRFRCDEDWDAMAGDAARRHCAKCDHDVHDLSELTEAEARALVDGADQERLCVRYAVDGAGEVVHRPEATRPTDRLLAWAAVAAVPMLAIGLGASQGPERSGAATSLGASAMFAGADGETQRRMQAAIDEAVAAASGEGDGLASTGVVASNPGAGSSGGIAVATAGEAPLTYLLGDVAEPASVTPTDQHLPLHAGPEPGKPVRKLMGKIMRPEPRFAMGVVAPTRPPAPRGVGRAK